MTIDGELLGPELQLFGELLGDAAAARKLATAPGGWRNLKVDELRALSLNDHQVQVVTAIQILVLRSWPSMPKNKLIDAGEIAKAYTPRLCDELDEVVVAVALDGDGCFRGEVEVGRNTGKGFGLESATVLRAMIKAGAEAFVVVITIQQENHSCRPTLCTSRSAWTRPVKRSEFCSMMLW
jgi:DNA repair protein RadC